MGQTWEADKMLDVYIYDYLVKRNLQATAKAFMAEGKVATGPVAIDAPGGFLFEWWSVFWDIFIARTNENHSDAAAAYFKVQQLKNKDQLLLRQYQLMQQRQAVQFHQLRNANPPPNGSISDGIMGSSAASPLAANVYGEHLKNPNSINSETLKSVDGNQGQLIQGHAGNISLALQQIQGRNLQSTDIRPGSGVSPRPLPGDPLTLYGQRAGQGKAGLGCSSGFQGASGSAMLDGWPLTSEQLLSNLGPQASRPFLQSSNQYQVLTADPQQLMVQTHMQGDIGNSHGFGGMDPQRFRTLQRAGLNVKDGQPNGNDGQVGSPLQTSSPMVKNEQAELLVKTRMSQMQSMAQKPQDQMLQQHQLQQNNRKRKPSSSGAANSSGPSNSQPSTPSTNNTQGDGVATANDMPHASSMAKSSMMYGTDGVRRLGSSSNHMDDLENLGDIGALEDQMESFFSQDGDGRDLFAQDSPAENNANTSKEHGGDQNHGHPRT